MNVNTAKISKEYSNSRFHIETLRVVPEKEEFGNGFPEAPFRAMFIFCILGECWIFVIISFENLQNFIYSRKIRVLEATFQNCN